MITVAAATPEDVQAVIDDLSEVSRAEHAVQMRRGPVKPRTPEITYCARDELGPLFVFGLTPTRRLDEWHTSFAATQRYFEMGAAGVRILRRFARKLMTEYPTRVYVCETTSPHPEVARWYAALGADIHGNRHRPQGVFTFSNLAT